MNWWNIKLNFGIKDCIKTENYTTHKLRGLKHNMNWKTSRQTDKNTIKRTTCVLLPPIKDRPIIIAR
jgi:hypothetical protein